MTLNQFVAEYYCKLSITYLPNNTVEIKTEIIKRFDKSFAHKPFIIILDLEDTLSRIAESKKSSNPQDWDDVVDINKRALLLDIAKSFPIDNYYPLDTNVDISNMYIAPESVK